MDFKICADLGTVNFVNDAPWGCLFFNSVHVNQSQIGITKKEQIVEDLRNNITYSVELSLSHNVSSKGI